jgi:hypothetical protein
MCSQDTEDNPLDSVPDGNREPMVIDGQPHTDTRPDSPTLTGLEDSNTSPKRKKRCAWIRTGKSSAVARSVAADGPHLRTNTQFCSHPCIMIHI